MSRSVERAGAVLRAIAASPAPIGLAALTRQLNIPKSTLFGILASLQVHRFVVSKPEGYAIGAGAFEVGSKYTAFGDLHSTAAPVLKMLTNQLEVTSHFAVLDGDEVLYVLKQDPPNARLKLASSIGIRLPANETAVGKAQLASTEHKDLAKSAGMGEAEWQQIREDGYAVDEGMTAPGVRCVASPVYDNGSCLGAIGISKWLDPSEDVPRIAQVVRDAANSISQLLNPHEGHH